MEERGSGGMEDRGEWWDEGERGVVGWRRGGVVGWRIGESGGMEESGSGGMEDTEGETRGGDADVREEKGGTTDGAYGLYATHVHNNAHCIHTYINTHVCMYV